MMLKESIKWRKYHQWTEEDFSQLYPHPPQIYTTETYFFLQLEYLNHLITVPVPKNIHKKSLTYLLHRAIFFYLLEKKDENPLLKAAQVIGFMTVNENVQMDYTIWKGEGILNEKLYLKCLYYSKGEGLQKYLIYQEIDGCEKEKSFLVRSLYDGKFCTMKRFEKKSEEDIIYFQKLKELYAKLHHPFISELLETFMTKQHVYFIFNYIPTTFFYLLVTTDLKFNEAEAYFYFSQIVYALFYLHQQNALWGQLNSKLIGIGDDGHIIIHHDLISLPRIDSNKEKQKKNNFKYLRSLILSVFYESSEDDFFKEEITVSPQLDNFLTLLSDSVGKQGEEWRRILSHKWVQQQNSETILSKSMPPPRQFPHFPNFNNIKSTKQRQLQKYDKSFSYCNLGYHRVQVNAILKKYTTSIKTCKRSRIVRVDQNCIKSNPQKWIGKGESEINQRFDDIVNKLKQIENKELVHDLRRKRKKKKQFIQ